MHLNLPRMRHPLEQHGMTMTIGTGTSEPVSQKQYLITMKDYQWVKEEIEKLFTAKVI